MKSALFVTGTDTGVGKTLATSVLLAQASARGLRTAALKPIASGCYRTPNGLRNIDAELLRKTMSVSLAYEQVNPYAFEPPVAPHILMAEQHLKLDPQAFAASCLKALPDGIDQLFIEGAGGWRVPLGEQTMMSELASAFTQKIVLVVGLKLGCINHALLTAEAIRRDGCQLAGWVANCLEPDMLYLEENMATLESHLDAPRLLTLPFIENSHDETSDYTSLEGELALEYKRVRALITNCYK